jgi:transposase|tara:strand:+ start:242 stop:754 length:513 start_codon:yes stop_codon:yes gene_type:complete
MGYHTTKCISEDDLSRIEDLIKTSTLAADTKRLQCIYFRSRGYSVEEIGNLTQFSTGHVRRVWSAYFKEGIEGLLTKPRGGRNHYFLDESDEAALLSQHTEAGSEGLIVEIDALHRSLCERVGKRVALSTTYRLAHRHGWRKIAPRPFHVNRDAKQAESFKFFSKIDRRS